MTNATEKQYRIRGGNSLAIGGAKSFSIQKLGDRVPFRSPWVTVASGFRSYTEAAEALDLLLKSDS